MKKEKDRVFQIAIVLAGLNLLFDLIAFVSPAWLESIPEFHSSFVRIGLWVACFNNFNFPEDYVSKEYQGCWYVYYPEYDYIRYWFNPGWFYAVQMLSLSAFICRCVILLIIGLMACDAISKDYKRKPFRIALSMLAYTTCTSIIVLSIMGVKSKNRDWMPRPDQNRLSWGYGFAVMAGFCSVFGLMAFMIIYLREHWKHEYEKSTQHKSIPMQSQVPHSAGTAPNYGYGPHQSHKSPTAVPGIATMSSEPVRPNPYARHENVTAMTMPYQQAPPPHNPYPSASRYTPGVPQITATKRPSESGSNAGRDTVV